MVLRADRRLGKRADRRGLRPARQAPGRRSSAAFRQPAMPPGDGRSVSGGVLVDSWFSQLPSLIPAGDLLVLNTTRVRHARLLGARASGAPAEVLLIHPAADDSWIAIGKPGSALQPGKQVALGDGVAVETIEVLADGYRRVRFVGASAAEAIARFGRLPLPPYITRDPTDVDERRYQTVYAGARAASPRRRPGSTSPPSCWTRCPPRAWSSRGSTCRSARARSSRWKWRIRASTPCTPSATRSPRGSRG